MSLGLYIHVPFCTSRCEYCAFATWADRFDFLDDYVDLVVREIALRRRELRAGEFSTVYLGGGTPSLLSPAQLERILVPVLSGSTTEVTMEANPESLSEKISTYLDLGITRISLGVQSLRDSDLELLGRAHSAASAKEAIEKLQASSMSFSTDFIFGVRGSKPIEMLADIAALAMQASQPEHISIYGLTIEPGTPLASKPWLFPNDDEAATTYLEVSQLCADLGYECYEISNFARDGRISRHNWNYWVQAEYLGVGPSAHSYLGGVRSWNIRDSYRWGHALNNSRDTVAGSETLSEEEHIFEGLSLALRTRLGVPVAAIDLAAIPEDLYEVTSDGRFVLSAKGRLVEGAIALLLDPEAIERGQLVDLQALDLFVSPV